MIPVPKIALVGRPNVGKSTLFNRICGHRKAITDSRPGSTRDRNYAQAAWRGMAFELIDTGGLLLATDDPLLGPASMQARLAISEADVVVLVTDARAGLLPDDEAIARDLRRRGKRVVVAVNKAEGREDGLSDFTRLGFERMAALSAEHGRGVGDLLDLAVAGLPRVEAVDEDPTLRIALVGRPNVGKSSLLNRLLGTDRAVVSPLPGTTRDAVDGLLERAGRRYLFVDTAGIRRQRLLAQNVDHVSVVQARHALERADVAVILLDAAEGMREMDATIAGYVEKAGRGLVLAVNKWDRAPDLHLTPRGFEAEVRRRLRFLAYARVTFVSALRGRGLSGLLEAAHSAHQASRQRVTTGQLNRVLAHAMKANTPKAARGNRPIKLLFATQVGVGPPTFVLSLNTAADLHFSYKRYLENKLRDAFGFEGSPIVLKTRQRRH